MATMNEKGRRTEREGGGIRDLTGNNYRNFTR